MEALIKEYEQRLKFYKIAGSSIILDAKIEVIEELLIKLKKL